MRRRVDKLPDKIPIVALVYNSQIEWRYKLVKFLANGSEGSVYSAVDMCEDCTTAVNVALKFHVRPQKLPQDFDWKHAIRRVNKLSREIDRDDTRIKCLSLPIDEF